MPYNPAEPRDATGRWTSGGKGPGRDPATILYPNLAPTIEGIAYNGHYHDDVVDWLLNLFKENNVPCIKSVPVTAINGTTTAIIDIVCKPNQDGSLNFIEVKTGENPTFTAGQSVIYPMAIIDNHLITTTDKLAPLGFPRGTTLPAANVDIAYAAPGQHLRVIPIDKLLH